MKIREFQTLMKDLYLKRDQRRGKEKTFIWLVEEVGELAKTFNKGKSFTKDYVEGEFADIFAWLCSVANLLDVDLEKAVLNKYNGKCPRCKKNPCDCEFR